MPIDKAKMLEEGLQLLQLMRDDKLSRAAAARKLGLSIEKARFREAAATRFLRHPRNRQHPLARTVVDL